MKRLVALTEELLKNLSPSDFDEPAVSPRVLIVEDDKNDADAEKQALSAMGCEVDLATSGEEAIRRINSQPASPEKPYYRILFLDLKLQGGLTGIDVLSYAKIYRPSLPVIVITGIISNNYMLEEASRIGYFGLVKKPLERESITEIFQKHHIKAKRAA